MAKYKTKTFTKDFMRSVLWEDVGVIVLDEIYDTTRWSVIHTLVFKYEDQLYKAEYSCGATECQDERPWEYDDNVVCLLVEPVLRTITDFSPIEEEA